MQQVQHRLDDDAAADAADGACRTGQQTDQKKDQRNSFPLPYSFCQRRSFVTVQQPGDGGRRNTGSKSAFECLFRENMSELDIGLQILADRHGGSAGGAAERVRLHKEEPGAPADDAAEVQAHHLQKMLPVFRTAEQPSLNEHKQFMVSGEDSR